MWAGAVPFGFKGADIDLAVGVEEAKRNALRRFYGSGDLHFVTCGCSRRPYLGSVRARNRFVKILEEVRSRHGFALLGYVLMPEHVQLLIGEPEQGNPSKVLQVVKQKVSRPWRGKKTSSGRQMEFAFVSSSVAAPAFWQRRFSDFNVWSEKKLKEKLHYMHRNPVDRKLVKHPKDWPWSSWSFYARGEQGLIRIDDLIRGPEKCKIRTLEPEECGTQLAPISNLGATHQKEHCKVKRPRLKSEPGAPFALVYFVDALEQMLV